MAQSQNDQPDPDFESYELSELLDRLESQGSPWLPFLEGKNLLTGLYTLKVGAEDKQQPHDTDEVYYVISGKGMFTAGTSTQSVSSGTILFVKAEVPHKFFDISEDIVLLVFFDR